MNSAGRGTHVEGPAADGVDAEGVQRVGELDAATGHERRRGGHLEIRVVVHELARLAGRTAGHGHVTGKHVGGRASATRTGPDRPAGCRAGASAPLQITRESLCDPRHTAPTYRA